MATFTDNANLNKYVSPILLKSAIEAADNFTSFFGKVNAGAKNADGVNMNLLVNDFSVETGMGVDDTLAAPTKVADKKAFIPWTPWTTPLYRIPETELRQLTYAKDAAVKQALSEKVASHLAHTALHAVAPASDGTNTPLIVGTGANDGTRKMITKKDILNLRKRYKGKNFVLVLCKNHLIDLLSDDLTSVTDKVVLSSLSAGTITKAFGINITVNEDMNIRYTAAGNRRAFAAAADANDKQASVIVEKGNTLFDLNTLLMQYIAASEDTVYKIPQSRTRFYGQYIAMAIQEDKERGVIVDGVAS